jgi:hypothetical protein
MARLRPTLGLVAIDTRNHKLLQYALNQSIARMSFDDVLIFSDVAELVPGARTVLIEKLRDIDDYNEAIIGLLAQHAVCDFYLVIQYDGFVLDATKWVPDFLTYDYVGAPWPNLDIHNVGNGGFSLRSRRLIDAVYKIRSLRPSREAEDVFICRTVRPTLETTSKVRFARPELAINFAFESPGHPKSAFGFHGVLNLAIAYQSSPDLFFDAAPRSLLVARRRELEFGALFIDADRRQEFLDRMRVVCDT